MDNGKLALAPHLDGRAAGPPDRKPDPRPDDRPPEQPKAPGRGWRPFAVLAALAVVFAGLFALGLVPRLRGRVEVKELAASDAPPPVNVVVAKAAGADIEVVLPGSTRADEETAVLARTNGYLEKWLVDTGDRVTADQLMAVIATPEVDRELEQNRATLLQTRANVEAAAATLQRNEADRDVARANFDRSKSLVGGGSVSRQEFDTADGAIKTAEATVSTGRANVKVAEANVKVADANVRRLENLQSFQRVKAPFAGVVTARGVDTGALVTAGQSTGTAPAAGGAGSGGGGGSVAGSRELFRVARTDPLRVYVNVPQAATPYVRVGQPAGLRAREHPGVVFPGAVARTANTLDPTARTLTTEVRVANADGRLMPGMFVQVAFTQHRDKPPVIVPGAALITRTDGTVVAVVGPGDKVEYRKVTVGHDNGSTAEVVTGLSGGERVVVNMVEEVPNGTAVRPVPMPEEPAAKK